MNEAPRTFTTSDKLRALYRELALRRNVYAKRVRAGLMPPELAERELALIEAIIADYKEPPNDG